MMLQGVIYEWTFMIYYLNRVQHVIMIKILYLTIKYIDLFTKVIELNHQLLQYPIVERKNT